MQIIAQHLSEEEIAGLKEMFKVIDADNSGQITFEELKHGLERFGAKLNESEIYDLMHAVSIAGIMICSHAALETQKLSISIRNYQWS